MFPDVAFKPERALRTENSSVVGVGRCGGAVKELQRLFLGPQGDCDVPERTVPCQRVPPTFCFTSLSALHSTCINVVKKLPDAQPAASCSHCPFGCCSLHRLATPLDSLPHLPIAKCCPSYPTACYRSSPQPAA